MNVIKIEFETLNPEDAYFKLQKIAEQIRAGYSSGEYFEVLCNFIDALECEN